MNSESPLLRQPYRSCIVLKSTASRAQLSDLAEAAGEDLFYASSVQKTEDKTEFLLNFYSFAPVDDSELRSRLVLLAALTKINDLEILSSTCEICPDKNWLEEVHEAFPPRVIGKFFVYGSHYDDAPDPDHIPLKIDAATAFGSGEHDTTQLCLEALSAFTYRPENILDMGCGSGILAIAAQKLWPQAHVFGVDIDAESVRVAQRHAAMNDTKIIFECGDGYALDRVKSDAPYDLIIANILTRPLIAMAGDAAAACQGGGILLLSGLLERQAGDVIAAHEKNGFVFIDQTIQNNWACLILRKG